MTTQTVDVNWQSKMAFRANVDGFDILLDAEEPNGGENHGPRPKPLLLAALGGCTGMDVIAILAKMKVIPEYFNVKVEGDVTEEPFFENE